MGKETILVTGSNGLLGQKLTDLYLQKEHIQLIATGKGMNRHPSKEGYVYQEMDITDPQNVREVLEKYKPSVLIHTAAMTQVDDCEFKKEECDLLNVNAVKHLAELSSEMTFHLVHLSTDFIFDGTKSMYTETDEANPLSYYGWSKLEAEKMVVEHAKSWSILRTILVYGQVADMSRSNIILWTYNTLKEQKSAKVVYDQFRTPTLAEDLAMGCFLAADQKAQGIFNIAGKDNRAGTSPGGILRVDALLYTFGFRRVVWGRQPQPPSPRCPYIAFNNCRAHPCTRPRVVSAEGPVERRQGLQMDSCDCPLLSFLSS